MFSELLSDISFRQSCRRSCFNRQGELASYKIKIKSQVRISNFVTCNWQLLRKTFQEGKLKFLCIALLIGFVTEEVFFKKLFFVHALFESKHKINVDFRRLINIDVRGENLLAFTCNPKQTRKLE